MKSRSFSLTSRRIALFSAFCLLPWLLGGKVASADPQDAGQTQTTTDDQPTVPPKVGDTAPDFELNELKGTSIKLSALAENGPVVLVQLRGYPGYQCPFCTAQVGKFLEQADKFSAAKTSVVFVYPGPAEGLQQHADEFVRGQDFPANFYLLLDPDYTAVNLYGLRWDAPKETAYPATFVLNQKMETLFAKVSHSHGDRSEVADVLAALPQ